MRALSADILQRCARARARAQAYLFEFVILNFLHDVTEIISLWTISSSDDEAVLTPHHLPPHRPRPPTAIHSSCRHLHPQHVSGRKV